MCWSGSRLDLGYIILLSCNYEMCGTDLEPNEPEELVEEGCSLTWGETWTAPEASSSVRGSFVNQKQSRAERARKKRKNNSFLRLSVGFTSASSAAEDSPPAPFFSMRLADANIQHPASLIMTIISAWCSFLDLLFFFAAADRRSRSVVSASVCVLVWGHFSI